MATFFEYKCKGCGYTVNANPKGKDMVMMGEIHNYLCQDCKEIVDVLYEYGKKPFPSNVDWFKILHLTSFSENSMKNRSHPNRWLLKWSRGDKVLLPALSGVVKTIVLTVQRYKLIMKVPNFYGIICNIHEMYNACRACITAGPTSTEWEGCDKGRPKGKILSRANKCSQLFCGIKRNCVKSCKMFASVESFKYFCR